MSYYELNKRLVSLDTLTENQLPFVLPECEKEDEKRNNEFVVRLLGKLIHCRNPRHYLLILCLVYGMDVEEQFGCKDRSELMKKMNMSRACFYEMMKKIKSGIVGEKKRRWKTNEIAKLIELLKEIYV